MTFEIDINGRTRMVAVEKTAGGAYRVSLDGETHEVDAARVGVWGLSLLHRETGLSRDVQVTPGSTQGELLVTLAGRIVAATVNGRRWPPPRATRGRAWSRRSTCGRTTDR